LLALLGVSFLSGCSKCWQLAEKICACEDSTLGQENCRKSFAIQGQHKGLSRAMSEDKCEQILAGTQCDCIAIRNHQFELCGMTREIEQPKK
jgi:hypothetical protein